jgi:hypothetical protein
MTTETYYAVMCSSRERLLEKRAVTCGAAHNRNRHISSVMLSSTLLNMVEFVEAERRCCPFFDIALRVTPEHGPLWVRFSGRAGTKQFIEADGAEWIRPVRSIAHS